MRKKTAMVLLILCLLLIPQSAAWGKGSVEERILQELYKGKEISADLIDTPSKTLLSLELYQEMEGKVCTYEDAWMLTGKAEPDTQIHLIVYTVSETQTPIIWYMQEMRVGSSRLFQKEVPLRLLGTQYLMIAVQQQEEAAACVYAMDRKGETVRDQLLEYELNLYEEYGLS